MVLAVVVLIFAIALFGIGAVVDGLLWLMAVGVIALVVSIALAIGVVRGGARR